MNLVPRCGSGFWVGVGVRCVYCRRGTFTSGDAFSAPFSYVLPKGAFCVDGLTENRTLHPPPHGKAHFACGSHQKAHSVSEQSRRVRLSVRVRAQNALFRRMCFSSPAQTSGGLTEKRTLQPSPHVKAHSASATPPRRDGKPHFALESDRRSPRPIHTSRAPYGR